MPIRFETINPEDAWGIDSDFAHRLAVLINTGISFFSMSRLIQSALPLSDEDLERISEWHQVTNPRTNEWRTGSPLARLDAIEGEHIADPSSYGNWDAPGGPAEHISLATAAVPIIIDLLQSNLRHGSTSPPMNEIILKLSNADARLAIAAAALHDEGRKATHIFHTTSEFGDFLLQEIGIRDDVLSLMPTENVMLVPENDDLLHVLLSLDPLAVIVRIADEFGKRVPGQDRLYGPEDYSSWDRQQWLNGYLERRFSGYPSDAYFRDRAQLHVDNVPRYFEALDRWVQSVSTLRLADITDILQQRIGATLPTVSRQ